MAIWQWSGWLVPRLRVEEHFGKIPDMLEQDVFESLEWWETKIDLPMNHFTSILPRVATPGTEKLIMLGSAPGNRVDLELRDDETLLENFFFRIDLREVDFEFVNSLIDFAKGNDLLFYSLESKEFFNPGLQDLLSQIEKSPKLRFVENPQAFFREQQEELEALNTRVRKTLQ